MIMCLFALSACMPQEQNFKAAAQPAAFEQGALIAADGATLPLREWLPAKGHLRKKPKALLIALHGFNDYSRAFESTGAYLSQQGIAVFAYDQRGFGDTPDKGIWAGEQNLVRDVKQCVQALQARYPDVPVYLLGESMGAAVVITAATEKDFPKLGGVVLVAPAVWGSEGMNLFFRSTLWLMAHTMPWKQFTGSDLKVLASNNFDMLRAMAADPFVIKSTRVDAVYGVVGLMGTAYDRVPKLQAPVLLLYGARDQVIPPSPIEEALGRFPNPVTYAHYPWAYHMLLRDLEGHFALADIAAWITRRSAVLPSGVAKASTPGHAVELKMARRFYAPRN